MPGSRNLSCAFGYFEFLSFLYSLLLKPHLAKIVKPVCLINFMQYKSRPEFCIVTCPVSYSFLRGDKQKNTLVVKRQIASSITVLLASDHAISTLCFNCRHCCLINFYDWFYRDHNRAYQGSPTR